MSTGTGDAFRLVRELQRRGWTQVKSSQGPLVVVHPNGARLRVHTSATTGTLLRTKKLALKLERDPQFRPHYQ